MGCINSKSATTVPKPEISKPKKLHTSAPKPETQNYHMDYNCTSPILIPGKKCK